MPFKPFPQGNKLYRRRKREGGGRPTNAQREMKRVAADTAKRYLEGRLKEALDQYLAACGIKIGKKRIKKADPATLRHYVERFIGPAPRSLILDLQDSVESFFEQVEKMGDPDKD